MALKMSELKDHRVRVGFKRTEKTRNRLLAAVMATFARNEQSMPPNIDDVLREAKVSRTTFYKHFLSLEDAVNMAGRNLVEEMRASLAAVFYKSEDPLLRMATGFQIYLLRSVTDPIWGAFVSKTDYFSRDPHLLEVIKSDLEDARRNGAVRFSAVEAARSLFIGAMIEAIRHLIEPDLRRRAYVEELTTMLLCGLGVEYERAQGIVRERAILIRGLAPDFLPWWRDPWHS